MLATKDDVIHAYRLLLGREADPGGLASFNALVLAGIDTSDLVHLFMESPEFRARMGRLTGGAIPTKPSQGARLICHPCTKRQIESAPFKYWAGRMGLRPGHLHRKPWEWCFITQALSERGVLSLGRRGLGFAVGEEPLTSLFAGMGCQILATDLEVGAATDEGWVDGKQHASGLQHLNARGLCSTELFDTNVKFRNVDMRDIPNDLTGYDFLWSSCAMEHLGSLKLGMDFVVDTMDCLQPGGIAVHTTEVNVESDTHTLETGHDVIYRRKDLLELAERLKQRGHQAEPFEFDFGDTKADSHVEEPPYSGKICLKLRIGRFASTSIGLIVTRSQG